MQASELRDRILQSLKNEKDFADIASENINGNYFSAVDLKLPCTNGNSEIFRVAVVKHNGAKAVT